MKLQPQNTQFPRSNPSWRPLAWVLASLVLGAFPVLGSTNIVLHLRNGDRLSGVVVRENSRSIIVRTPIAGRVTVPLTWIERREAPGIASAGSPPPVPAAPAAVQVSPAPAQDPQAPPPSPVAQTTPPPAPSAPSTAAPNPPSLPSGSLFARDWMPGWLAPFTTNWHGNVGLGMNLGFGTTDRQTFFATANATHSWRRVVNAVNLNAAYGLVDQVEAANRLEGVVKTDVFLDRKRHLYAYNLALGGYDSIRLIDRRLEEGVGLDESRKTICISTSTRISDGRYHGLSGWTRSAKYVECAEDGLVASRT